jgi:hypothetical protein
MRRAARGIDAFIARFTWVGFSSAQGCRIGRLAV